VFQRLGLATADQPELLATTKNPATASHPDDHGDPNDIPRLPAIPAQPAVARQAGHGWLGRPPSTPHAASTTPALARKVRFATIKHVTKF
jgi:hypothetical protein